MSDARRERGVMVMDGRTPPTTKVVLHQIEAWCVLDRIEPYVPTALRPAILLAKRHVEQANGALEFPERREAA